MSKKPRALPVNPLNKYLYHCFDNWFHPGGTVWVYSDPHFGDPDVASFRKDAPTDEQQVARINSRVGKNDTIIFLGDIGDVSYIKRIRGYKVLVKGNHDKGTSTYQREIVEKLVSDRMTEDDRKILQAALLSQDSLIIDKYEKVVSKYMREVDNYLFDEVYNGPIWIADRMLLSHEPINLPFAFNVYGHDHSNWHAVPNGLNVCAELINYEPVNLIDLFRSGYLKGIKDIHRYTIDAATARTQAGVDVFEDPALIKTSPKKRSPQETLHEMITDYSALDPVDWFEAWNPVLPSFLQKLEDILNNKNNK